MFIEAIVINHNEWLTSCMNFLHMGLISLLSVALNIITCLSCGVILNISCTSARMSMCDIHMNIEWVWYYSVTVIKIAITNQELRAFCRIRREQNAWCASNQGFDGPIPVCVLACQQQYADSSRWSPSRPHAPVCHQRIRRPLLPAYIWKSVGIRCLFEMQALSYDTWPTRTPWLMMMMMMMALVNMFFDWIRDSLVHRPVWFAAMLK